MPEEGDPMQNREGRLSMLSRRFVLVISLALLRGSAARAVGSGQTVPAPTPPPSGGTPAPASVATPVRGTDLTEVWNLQFAGTGPRYALSNGKWSGVLDAYLIGAGVVMGNTRQLYWNVGSSTKTLEKYDFTGAPQLHINGTGTANVRDCLFDGAATGMAYPIDSNANLSFGTTTLTVLMDHCTFDKATCYQGAGTLTFSYCRIKNQAQGFCNSGFAAPGIAVITYDHCYITGGGIAPAAAAHVELTQMARSAPGTSFTCTNTFIDISRDGQTTTASWGSGWTGVWAVVGDYPSTFTNCIMIGAISVNANPANPNVVSCLVAYNTGSTPTLTNCVMEAGCNGYTKNQQGTATHPTDGGGNRSYANGALTAANFN
jgi:hypothetical protein